MLESLYDWETKGYSFVVKLDTLIIFLTHDQDRKNLKVRKS